MKEQAIMHRILLAASRGASRLFRNNTGVAWAGKRVDQVRGNPRQVLCHDGDVIVRAAQPIKYGLCVGSSDLIGWTQHVVTPEDVGRKVALFSAVECKSATGRATEEQKNFIDRVQDAGGIAGIARSEQEALTLLSTWTNVSTPSEEK
jgi:hypothetical protein